MVRYSALVNSNSATNGGYKATHINTIPPDVLSAIFLLSLRDNSREGGILAFDGLSPTAKIIPGLSFTPGSSSDPMYLAQVSCYWRSVALSTPLLWSSISVRCGNDTRGQPIPLLKTWLSRSLDCPLTISFIENFNEVTGNWSTLSYKALCKKLVSLFIAHAYRWKIIDFRSELGLCFLIDGIQGKSVPLLESATIIGSDMDRERDNHPERLDTPWNVIYRSPRLCRAQWDIDYTESRLKRIPWTILTSINLTVSIPSLFEVLPHCSNLMNLTFVDAATCVNTAFLDPSLRQKYGCQSSAFLPNMILPYLCSLSITGRHPDLVLQQVALPALWTLYFEKKAPTTVSAASSLMNFLTRSKCLLRNFTYRVYRGTADEIREEAALVDVLSSRSMSLLRNLVIASHTTNRTVAFLTRSSPGTMIVLPALETLVIDDCHTTSGVLLRMIESRRVKRTDEALLRNIQVNNWNRNDIDLKGLGYLSRRGLIVDV